MLKQLSILLEACFIVANFSTRNSCLCRVGPCLLLTFVLSLTYIVKHFFLTQYLHTFLSTNFTCLTQIYIPFMNESKTLNFWSHWGSTIQDVNWTIPHVLSVSSQVYCLFSKFSIWIVNTWQYIDQCIHVGTLLTKCHSFLHCIFYWSYWLCYMINHPIQEHKTKNFTFTN